MNTVFILWVNETPQHNQDIICLIVSSFLNLIMSTTLKILFLKMLLHFLCFYVSDKDRLLTAH